MGSNGIIRLEGELRPAGPLRQALEDNRDLRSELAAYRGVMAAVLRSMGGRLVIPASQVAGLGGTPLRFRYEDGDVVVEFA